MIVGGSLDGYKIKTEAVAGNGHGTGTGKGVEDGKAGASRAFQQIAE